MLDYSKIKYGEHRRPWAVGKIQRCIKGAREAMHDFLKTKDRRYKEIAKEAMQDARYWQEVLKNGFKM